LVGGWGCLGVCLLHLLIFWGLVPPTGGRPPPPLPPRPASHPTHSPPYIFAPRSHSPPSADAAHCGNTPPGAGLSPAVGSVRKRVPSPPSPMKRITVHVDGSPATPPSQPHSTNPTATLASAPLKALPPHAPSSTGLTPGRPTLMPLTAHAPNHAVCLPSLPSAATFFWGFVSPLAVCPPSLGAKSPALLSCDES
jgi:hypothetical protein